MRGLRITFLRTLFLFVTLIHHLVYIFIGKGLIHKHSWVLEAQFGKWLKGPQSRAGGSQQNCVLVIRRGSPLGVTVYVTVLVTVYVTFLFALLGRIYEHKLRSCGSFLGMFSSFCISHLLNIEVIKWF
jgi:hypothetical protein